MLASKYSDSTPGPSPVAQDRMSSSEADSKPLPPLPQSAEKPSPARSVTEQKESRVPYTRPMYSTPHMRKASREQQSTRWSDEMEGTQTTTPDTVNTDDATPQSMRESEQGSTLASSPVADEDTPIKPRKSLQKGIEAGSTPPPSQSIPGADLSLAEISSVDRLAEPDKANTPPKPPRKVFSRRGKPCIVRIPADASTGKGEHETISLSQYALRLQDFANAGYSLNDYSNYSVHTKEPDDRLELDQPDTLRKDGDSASPIAGSRPTVYIPDKRLWEAYRISLVEARLAALGVVPAGEGTGSESGNMSMSRKGSSPLVGLASSPPPLTASASSQHGWANSRLHSGTFSPASYAHNSTPSANSPLPTTELGGLLAGRPGHLSRQSTVTSGAGSPAIHPALQQQFLPQRADTLPRSFSPLRPNIMSRGPSVISRKSADPFFDQRQSPAPVESSATDHQDPVEPTQRSLGPSPDPQSPVPNAVSSPSAPKVSEKRETALSRIRAQSYGLLTQPTPQGHQHNISESLERAAEKPQYYPGEFVDEGAKDVEKEKRVDDAPKVPLPSHSSNAAEKPEASKSGFNVNAPEFHFDPKSAHRRHISIPRNPFAPEFVPGAAKQGMATIQPTMSLVTAHANGQVTGGSSFDVNAPSFKPRSQSIIAPPSSEFAFSAKKPGSQAMARAFPAELSEAETPTSAKIFDGVSFSDVTKPSKKSRAVLIQKPGGQKSPASDPEPPEDESGRITQDAGRYKRGRMTREDDEDVPQFAVPSSPTPLPNHEDGGKPDSKSRGPLPEMQTPAVKNESDVDEEGEVSWSDYGIESPRRAPSPPDGSPPRTSHGTTVSSGIVRDMEAAARDETRSTGSLLASPKEQAKTPIDRIQASLLEDIDSGEGLERGARNIPALSPKKEQSLQSESRGGATIRSPTLEFGDFGALAHDSKATEVQSPRPSADWLHNQNSLRGIPSPIRKLNGNHQNEVSDWDDFLSDQDEQKFLSQTQISDARVKTLIEAVLQQHLHQAQNSQKEMDGSLKSLSVRNGPSKISKHTNDKSSSDADDEEDFGDTRALNKPPSNSIRSQKQLEAIQGAVREVMAATSRPVETSEQLEKQVQLRNDAEKRADDLQKLLTLSEREIVLFKESSDNHDRTVQTLVNEKHAAQQRVSALENIEREQRARASALATETTMLENTLTEYRTSSNKWRQEIDTVKAAREELQQTIDQLKREVADHLVVIDRSKRDIEHQQEKHASVVAKLQQAEETTIGTTRQLQGERESWRRKDEELAKSLAVHRTRLEEEFKLRQRLERELDRQGVHERNAIKATVSLDEARSANTRLTAEVAQLREEATADKNAAALHEREAIEAKDIARVEIQRNKTLLEAEIEVNNKKAENTRFELKTRLAHLQSELDAERTAHAITKDDHSQRLDQAHEQRTSAVREASESANAARADERQRFEQLTADLSKQHEQAMRNALAEHERATAHLNESLSFSHEKHAHLEDKIAHLTDKVTVAQAAAQAAAASAQAQKQATSTSQAAAPTTTAPRDQSQRISPQALRESILVLQEQLQERETRIDSLTTSLASQDPSLPTKYADRCTEITWLRELLNVRLDDLSELVNLLGLENFDQDAARDAAIRIRANLEMEAQERERLARDSTRDLSVGVGTSTPRQSANIPLPSLADIQGFATPKAAQLAAAWGNWRRGSTSFTSSTPKAAGQRLSPNKQQSTRPGTAGSNAGSAESTPSRPRTAQRPPTSSRQASAGTRAAQAKTQSFLSGLMTPPASNMRRTPISAQQQQQRQQSTRHSPAKQQQQQQQKFPSLRDSAEQAEEQEDDYRIDDDVDVEEEDDDMSSITGGAGDSDAQPLPLSLDLEMELADTSYTSETGTHESSPQKTSPAKHTPPTATTAGSSTSSPSRSKNQKPRTPPPSSRRGMADDEREGARKYSNSGTRTSAGIGEDGTRAAAGTLLEPFGGVHR